MNEYGPIEWGVDTNLPKTPIEVIKRAKQKIRKQLAEGKSAKELSIQKWMDIAAHIEKILNEKVRFTYQQTFLTSIGFHTCALCVQSMDEYEKKHGALTSSSNKCEVCAFAKNNRCLDEDSIYHKFESKLKFIAYGYKQEYEFGIIDLLANAKKMIEALKQLS